MNKKSDHIGMVLGSHKKKKLGHQLIKIKLLCFSLLESQHWQREYKLLNTKPFIQWDVLYTVEKKKAQTKLYF